jgi:hypothetical protein
MDWATFSEETNEGQRKLYATHMKKFQS